MTNGPAVREHRLTGHSGAKVTLYRTGRTTFVRKQASEPSLNERLRRQCAKQRDFNSRGVACPAVVNEGELDRLFYFDMAYIPGASIAHQVCEGNLPAAQPLAAMIASWVGVVKSTAQGRLPASIFHTKIRSVAANSAANPILAHHAGDIGGIAATIADMPWPELPQSECHGDCTLENILEAPDGSLWYIDFDSPDISSHWMDIAKLYQDLVGLWCLRRLWATAQTSTALRNSVGYIRQLKAEIDQVVMDCEPDILPFIPQLVVLNLLRTLPYCRDEATAKFVITRSHDILKGYG
jgi:hypothetical protein